MMRLWREEYHKPVNTGPGTAASVVVHVGIIAIVALLATPPSGLIALYELATRVIYLAPPDPAAHDGSMERVKFIPAAPVGPGAGFLRSPVPSTEPPRRTDELTFGVAGDLGADRASSPALPRMHAMDSVFTVVDVDSAVTRDPTSVAPVFPPQLLKAGIEGSVEVRYVVDSTGVADTTSIEIVRATRSEFVVAVLDALPLMKFIPARMGPKRVRQLVEQEFAFRIVRPVADTLGRRDDRS